MGMANVAVNGDWRMKIWGWRLEMELPDSLVAH